MFVKCIVQLVLAGLSLASAAADPQVNLGYATYEGTALANGVTQFLGMRYAAPPVDENRFRLAQAPLNETPIIQAKEHGPVCNGVDELPIGSAPLAYSEDCLFIDVYAPAKAISEGNSSLPVMLWLQGGAFVQLFNPNYNGTGLIEASSGKAIIVTFNYRVGAYGFLASDELQAEGNLNIGLHDQRTAMRWVQEHISAFGGDPDRVTLFGTSIGGGSVLLQTLAYGGNPPADDNVTWSAGIAQAVYMPRVSTVAGLQTQYNEFLNATNCSSLACLRSLDSAAIQSANIDRPFPGESQRPLFPYLPVIDGSLLTDTTSAMLQAGNFSIARPLIIGSSHTEGTLFATPANTTADIIAFLQIQYPNLTDTDIASADQPYAYTPQTYPGVNVTEAPLYYRLAAMYGDLAFSCPALTFAHKLSQAGAPTYLFRDNILDPVEVAAGYIVPHTWEVQAVWGPEYAAQYVALPGADSYSAGGVNSAIVPVVQKYWTSFAGTGGDPNEFREGGSPVWRKLGKGERLRLQTNATGMEVVKGWEWERCMFWEGLAGDTYI